MNLSTWSDTCNVFSIWMLCTFHSQLGKREPVIALRDHFAVSEDVIKLSVLVQQRKKVKGGSQAIENDCKTSKSDCLEDWYVIP